MAFDIAAVQTLYGANMTHATGADTYVLPRYNQQGTYWSCIWDAGGTDTISNASGVTFSTIDLRPAPLTGPNGGGYVSRVNGVWGGYTIANGVVIENAIGGSSVDTMTGNEADNRFTGNGGYDVIDGQGGNDTAVFLQAASEYLRAYNNGTIVVTHKNFGAEGADTLTSVEILDFADRDLSLVTFNAFHYLAANTDLLAAWGGANTGLAVKHYVEHGFQEARTTSFEGLRYIASHADLIAAFGANADIGAQHYATNGFAEGRQLTFNGLQYTATYGDLISAFGMNAALATQHYITNGHAEGRSAMFDAEFYLAKHTDLRAAFDTNTTVATQHFITNGFFEGRMSTNGGADTLIGSSSADRLNGGGSKDTMTGNAGVDTFVFMALSDTTNNSATADIITDFVSGTDKIDLSGIDANTDAGANEAFTSLIGSGVAFTAAGQLRLTDGVLYGNTNGEAGAEFAIVLTGVNAVTLADFVL